MLFTIWLNTGHWVIEIYMKTLSICSLTCPHSPSAEFTHLIKCKDSNTVAPQRYPSSVVERLFKLGPGCKPSGWWIAAEAQDAEIKGAHLLPSMWHWDMHDQIIQIGRFILEGWEQNGGECFVHYHQDQAFPLFTSLLSSCLYSAPAVLMKPTSQICNLLNYFQLCRHRCFYHSP